MKPVRRDLRWRLLLVALAAAAPAIAAIVVMQSVSRGRGRERTLADNLRLVRLAASQQASVFDGARSLLLTLGEFPPMRADDPAGCQDLLPNVLREQATSPRGRECRRHAVLLRLAARPAPDRQRQQPRLVRARHANRTTAVGDYQFTP